MNNKYLNNVFQSFKSKQNNNQRNSRLFFIPKCYYKTATYYIQPNKWELNTGEQNLIKSLSITNKFKTMKGKFT